MTHRPGAARERLRAALWFWPSVSACAGLLVALALLPVRAGPHSGLARWAWPTGATAATSLASTVATAVITAAGLTFSLTVVALQLASQQFSPRLLRSFARDRTVQTAMAVLVTTFVVALTTLRGLDDSGPLPVLALLLTEVLGLASAVVLLVFVGHIMTRLRVDSMMAEVHADTVRALSTAYVERGAGSDPPPDDLPGPDGGLLVQAWSSGFVRTVDPDALLAGAARLGVGLLLGVRPGDMVVRGAPVASAFPLSGAATVPEEALADAVREGVALGAERTEEQDVAFGLRQLVDIAVKAMSPAVNDPTTAAEAMSYCSDLLVRLLDRRLGPQLHQDAADGPWVVTPDRDLRYYLDLACAQLRRFGRAEPTVLSALLRLLRDVAANAVDDDQRRQVGAQCALVLAEVPSSLLDEDRAAVESLAERVGLALRGDVDAAYRDRAGETRSI